MPEPERPTCATCVYYDPESTLPIFPVISYGNPMPHAPVETHGVCRKSCMVKSHRKPAEWCGEHQDFPAYLKAVADARRPKPDPANDPRKLHGYDTV